MAYQPKSYKKFVATAATATLVASAVAPAASAAFSDVADRYKDAVDYLAAEKIAEGYPGGKFGTDDNIKRQDAAVMIAKALGAKADGNYADAGFSDVPVDRQWAVNYLVEQKIVSGKAAGKFGANDFTTREEMSKIIANAYKLVGDATNAFPFTDVSATFKEFVDALYENGITQGKDADSFGTGLVTRGEFALFIYRAEGSPVVNPTTPEVVSVSATNLKEVKVSFNSALDKKTAENAANYTFNAASGLTVEDAKLVGNDVWLTLSDNVVQQQSADLTIKNVKSEVGTIIADTTKTITFFDTVAPTVLDHRVVGPRKVEVTFSEPLEVAPTVKLDNGSISSSVQLSADGKKATVIFGVEPTEGVHTLEISGGADYAGFKVATVTKEFTYAKDTSAPTVTVSDAEPDQITLKFSKPVAIKSLANVSIFHTINNSAAYAGSNITAVDAIGGYSDTFTVTFNTPMPEGNTTVFLNTKENAFEDEWGNDVATQTLTTKVVLDKVAPTVLSVVAEDESEFAVKFSEDVKENLAETKANYVLTDKDGKTVSISGATLTYDDETYEVTFTGLNLVPGAYTLTVKNIEDSSFSSNKLVSQAIAFSVPDSTPWTISNEGVVSSDNTKIRVTFDEAMSTEGLTTLSNYALYNNSGVRVSFPANSSVVAINNKTVEIRLGAAVANLDAHNLRVAGLLKDAEGNGYSSTQFVQIGLTSDALTGASVVADSAVTKTSTTLSFKLNQELSGSLTPADFTIDADHVVGGASYVNNDGKATVTLTLQSGDTFEVDGEYTVEVDADALTNTYGTKNTAFDINVTDGLAPSVAKYDDGENEGDRIIEDNAVTAGSDFIITFNEVLGDGTALAASDLVLTEADGDVLTAGDDYTVNESGTDLIVTLTDDEFVGELTVATIAKPLYIRDAAGNRANAIAATTVTITSTVAADAIADAEQAVVDAQEALDALTNPTDLEVAAAQTDVDATPTDGEVATANTELTDADPTNDAAAQSVIDARNDAIAGQTVLDAREEYLAAEQDLADAEAALAALQA